MTEHPRGLPSVFLDSSTSSFTRFVEHVAPHTLPWNRGTGPVHDVPHGTTVLALTFDGGVLMAGDRRATMGNVIAQRDLEKVSRADDHTAVAFAGTVGLAKELVRLFQLELAHYEKLERRPLTLNGKAQRLAAMIRDHLAEAMQGLVVVPLLAGYDTARGAGRVFSFDVTGGPYEAVGFHCDGSGSPYARGALKKLYRPGLSAADATTVAVQALYDAADDDSATGGPDLSRHIYPSVALVTEDGYRPVPEEEVRAVAASVVAARAVAPEGPRAPLL
ncbi:MULTISPECIES: proteasome subunit beta [unclassified Streptomyces]|uniref:proteasome subunit beta n=1 Tax=unclassified Streptomyces TaxID=2593676 RepID=UPI000DBA717C|nr:MULTISPECIES: proteasome subunit beta [unclassified Streptomyces]MYT74413.1 proteasome subunit beta [Streptomyces sp. SID8367]RAJ91391.1 proteasome beta subunit [Streptomyces sp. PsTaAH-137]